VISTFAVVTFAWSFAVALFVLYKLFHCKHAWELVDKTQLPSKLEEMSKQWKPTSMHEGKLSEMSRIKVLLCIKCPKCGAIKLIREDNS
jgi:hypothetical protein